MSHQSMVALLDGRLLSPTEPLLRPDDAGVVRGDGVFETTLAVDGIPRDLDEHLARLERSAHLLELTIPPGGDWRTGVDALLADRPAGQWSVRLTATRGPEGGPATCFVVRAPASQSILAQRAGISVLLLGRAFDAAAVTAAPWLLAGAKTLSYAMNMAALRFAAAHGADDVVFVDAGGALLEAPTATLVIARDRTLLSPPPEAILDGITARRLFAAAQEAGWRTDYQRLTRDDLESAEGAWLTSSVRLLAPITEIDGRPTSLTAPSAQTTPGDSTAPGAGAPGAALTAELAELLQMPTP